jgi:two-component system chemotaxis sensor kinase CheA
MQSKVFDSILDGVVVINEQLEVIYANQAIADLCGVSNRRMKGEKPLSAFIHLDEHLFKGETPLAEITEATLYKEIWYETTQGAEGWTQYSIQPLATKSSGVALWLVYFRDVTLEKTLHSKYRSELAEKESVIEELHLAQRKLKSYSDNLEVMVEERTADLKAAMTLQTAMLDSLGEGFLLFDGKGICQPYYSKVCPDIFGIVPASHHITKVMRLDNQRAKDFNMWINALFLQALSFDDIVRLAPVSQLEINDRTIKIDYFPLLNDENSLVSVVVVANDISDEIQVRKELEREKHFAFMIMKIIKYREQFIHFIEECDRQINSLVVGFPQDFFDNRESLQRALHSLRGGSATFSAIELEVELVKLEDYLKGGGELRNFGIEKITIINRQVQRLCDVYHDFVKKLEEYFKQPILGETRMVEVDFAKLLEWYERLGQAGGAREVRDEMKNEYIYEPLDKLFGHYALELERLGRSLSTKQFASLVLIGGETRVMADELGSLGLVLIHAIRNAADHGIESADERVKNGKPKVGKIKMQFERFSQGTSLWLKISIEDDGRGISPQKVRDKAIGLGLGQKLVNLTDHEVLDCLFLDAFSTLEKETSISGSGVGLSAVRQEVERLGGKVRIDSKLGRGTTLTLEIPISNGDEYLAEIA